MKLLETEQLEVERSDCRKEGIFTEEKECDIRRVGRMINCTSHQITRALDACIAAEVSPELTGMRGLVLGYVVRNTQNDGAVYQRDLENWLRIRRSSVTNLLQGMEQAGFVRRCPVERDARLKSLTATEKGMACYERIERCITNFEEMLNTGVSEDELELFQKILEKFMNNAQAAMEKTI